MRKDYPTGKYLTLTDLSSINHIRHIRKGNSVIDLKIDSSQGRDKEYEPIPYCQEQGRIDMVY